MAKWSFFDTLGLKKRRKYGKNYEYKNDDFYSVELTGSASQRLNRFFKHKLFALIRSVSYLFSHVCAKVYGTISITFGLLTLLMYFLGISADKSIGTAIIGILISVLSIPFLLSEQTIPMLLQDFRLTDYVFYEFFCMKRANKLESAVRFPILIAVAIGVLLAIIGYAVPAWQILLTVGVILFVGISFASPEFAFLTSFLLLPYYRYIPYSTSCLVIMVAIGIVSFLRKVIYGKRVLNIETYDVAIAIFTLLILISGIFVKGMESFIGSVEMIVLAMGYTLASNIITNRRLADCTLNSIIISSIIPSVLSIVQFIGVASRVGIHNIDTNAITDVFVRKNELAPFLLVAVILSCAMIIQNRRVLLRVPYVIGIVLNFAALVITGELFAIFTLLIGAVAYFALRSRDVALITIPVLVLIPYALLLIIPNEALDKLFVGIPSLSTAEQLFALWSSSVTAFANNFFVGIGIGKESFAEEMINYGITAETSSNNLFIEIALEAGVLALLIFVVILLVRVGHRSTSLIYVKHSQTAVVARVSEVCIVCLIAFGTANYIWSDLSAYYLFWCVFGIGSAAIRVAKKDYYDKLHYYEDTRDIDFSQIDIQLG